jgi:hypothetical protein
MKKALIILGVLLAVIAGLAVWQAHRPRRTPAGQVPLESLNPQNLSDFRKAFNNSPSSVRLVLLLSPT